MRSVKTLVVETSPGTLQLGIHGGPHKNCKRNSEALQQQARRSCVKLSHCCLILLLEPFRHREQQHKPKQLRGVPQVAAAHLPVKLGSFQW